MDDREEKHGVRYYSLLGSNHGGVGILGRA